MTTQATGNNTWTCHLGADHHEYAFVEFKRSHAHAHGYMVVIADVTRLMECFDRDSIGLPLAHKWKAGKFSGIRDFLDPASGPVDMPVIGFHTKLQTTRSWLGLIKGFETVGVVGFTNGRHRSRYLQFAGATTMPVEIHQSEAQALLTYCRPR